MPKRYWYVILTYVIMQASGFVFIPLLYMLTPFDPVSAGIYWNILSFLAGLIVVLWLMRPDMSKSAHQDSSPAWEMILWGIAGLFMALFANTIASTIETHVLGIDPGSENTEQIMTLTQRAPLFIVVTSLVAPILEEIIFRKIIFGQFYKRMNFFLAALLSALVFGIIHLEPEHLLVYASMGFVFAFLYVQTKRIIVPIAVHMAMNSVSVLMLSLDPEELEQKMQEFEQMQTVLIGG